MKKQSSFSPGWLGALLVFASLLPQKGAAQCMTYPVSLNQRVQNSTFICLGKVIGQESYPIGGQIFTLNTVEVSAWLKGFRQQSQIGVITDGGWLADRGQTVEPSLQLDEQNEFILFLQADNHEIDFKTARLKHPDLLQTQAFAANQGAILYQFGQYRDLHFPKKTEAETFSAISQLTGEPILTPDGQPFLPRTWSLPAGPDMMPITSFSPNPTNAGTIVPGEFLTILGSGFGASAGTVFFSNADDGGATFTASGVASDVTAWSDGSITVKVARRAGTGPINVNGTYTSSGNLTVNYSHLDINSNFSGWGNTTRQRYYHRNLNSLGGYTLRLNNTFPTSGTSMANLTAAADAFARSIITWRCETGINWLINGTTSLGIASQDGTNCVSFSSILPSGVLGQATSYFTGSANGSCNMANTVWWLAELDVMFDDDIGGGFSWNYGPGAPAFTEYDFESVSVHEMGHACGLGHRIADGDVMHYAIANSDMARVPSAEEETAVNARMTYSTAATCFNPANSGTPMILVPVGTCSAAVLPIELTRFWLNGQKNLVNVNWTTTTEINNAFFEIERSTDGQSFQKIGKTDGHGTTFEEKNYAFDDLNPPSGLLFYRLRQTDFDGKQSLSGIQTIRFNEKSGLSFSPNPAADALFISGKTDADLQVFNSLGQLVKTHFHENGQSKIDLHGLAKGLYFLVDLTGGERMEFFVE